MYSNFIFLDRFLFELLYKLKSHTHKQVACLAYLSFFHGNHIFLKVFWNSDLKRAEVYKLLKGCQL